MCKTCQYHCTDRTFTDEVLQPVVFCRINSFWEGEGGGTVAVPNLGSAQNHLWNQLCPCSVLSITDVLLRYFLSFSMYICEKYGSSPYLILSRAQLCTNGFVSHLLIILSFQLSMRLSGFTPNKRTINHIC